MYWRFRWCTLTRAQPVMWGLAPPTPQGRLDQRSAQIPGGPVGAGKFQGACAYAASSVPARGDKRGRLVSRAIAISASAASLGLIIESNFSMAGISLYPC